MLKKFKRTILLIGVVILLSLTHQTSGQVFVDITEEIDLPTYETAKSFGSGVTVVDYDKDGDHDVYILTGDGYSNILLQNDGTGLFQRVKGPLDLTMQCRTASWFDYNTDGLLDVFVVGDNYQLDNYDPTDFWVLFEQQENGDFVDVSAKTGLRDIEAPLVDGTVGGVSVGDLNMDGLLDLVITYYVGNPSRGSSLTGFNTVLYNSRGGEFRRQENLLKQSSPVTLWQPVIFDLDEDGFNEVYLAQDHERGNLFFDSDGVNFTNIARSHGLDHDQWDMGVTICDFDNDNDFDLHITNIKYDDDETTGNLILQNTGDFQFQELEGEGIEEGGWSWGASAQDFDNDGDFDLAVTNGYLSYRYDQSKFWSNEGGMQFTDNSLGVGFADTMVGTSLVAIDFDGDNDLDLIQTLNSHIGIEGYETPIRFLRNDLAHNAETNYLTIVPRMREKNKWAIGAKVSVKIGDKVMSRPITASTGFYSQEPAQAFFGLGGDTSVDEVRVIWPGGGTTVIENVTANQTLTVYDDGVLHRPFNLQADVDQNGIMLTWENSSDGISSYTVERSRSVEFSETQEYQTSDLHYYDEDVAVYTDYFYRVKAVRGEVVSEPSAVLEVFSADAPVAAPSDLIALRESVVANLHWTDNSDNELNFRIFRSLTPDFDSSYEIELDENSTDFMDENLEPGFDYYYKIRAERTGSVSDFSEVVSAVYVLEADGTEGNILVYPSPTERTIFIQIGDDELHNFDLIDLEGRVVDRWSMRGAHSRILKVPAGVYFIRMTGNGEASTSRIVIGK